MTRQEFTRVLAAGFGATAVGYSANETINIGVIGSGGRAQLLMRNIEPMKGAWITAVCDVWDETLAKSAQIAQPGAFQTKDYRELLDRKDIDVVLSAAPDHQHVPLTVTACQAGKEEACHA
jgi:predicted dehydrogenase